MMFTPHGAAAALLGASAVRNQHEAGALLPRHACATVICAAPRPPMAIGVRGAAIVGRPALALSGRDPGRFSPLRFRLFFYL